MKSSYIALAITAFFMGYTGALLMVGVASSWTWVAFTIQVLCLLCNTQTARHHVEQNKLLLEYFNHTKQCFK